MKVYAAALGLALIALPALAHAEPYEYRRYERAEARQAHLHRLNAAIREARAHHEWRRASALEHERDRFVHR
jgi:hypothetical protein